jgi:PBP1b-binding outer membrane lipoprotein LpoB
MPDREKKDHHSSEILFLQLVSMFQVAAMQHLGKIVSPITNKVERELDQAKATIDILDMVKEKTEGNLSTTEEDFLTKALFELHMNYVDEVKRGRDVEEKAAGTEETEGEKVDPSDEEGTASDESAEGDDRAEKS